MKLGESTLNRFFMLEIPLLMLNSADYGEVCFLHVCVAL